MVCAVNVQMYTGLFLYPVSFKLKHNRGFYPVSTRIFIIS